MEHSLQVMILAAGRGTRLRPLTDSTPKCLVPVGGVPMLQRIIDKLEPLAPDRVVLNTCYLSGQVEDFVASTLKTTLRVMISKEPELLGAGGALKYAWPLLSENTTLLVVNADIITDFDLTDLLNFESEEGPEVRFATLPPLLSTGLLVDSEDAILGLQYRDGGRRWFGNSSFGGVSPITRLVTYGSMHAVRGLHHSDFGPDQSFSLWDLYDRLAQRGARLRGVSIGNSQWLDIGTPSALDRANRELA